MRKIFCGLLMMLMSASVSFAQESLSVVVDRGGPGTGIVFSSPNGILCGPNISPCSKAFSTRDTVKLTAAAAEGSTFESWRGCDRVSDVDCYVSGNRSRLVKVNFSLEKKRYKLRVTVANEGVRGEVISQPQGLLCANGICEGVFDADTEVRLRGWSLQNFNSTRSDWFGCDHVKYNYCHITMDDEKSLRIYNWW
jgi:hypothetical protein